MDPWIFIDTPKSIELRSKIITEIASGTHPNGNPLVVIKFDDESVLEIEASQHDCHLNVQLYPGKA